jgi:hypothetical protein
MTDADVVWELERSYPGLSFKAGTWDLHGEERAFWFVWVRYWLVCFLAMLLPFAKGALCAAAWARHRRRRAGLCPHCAYDLRATPDRCPECGHVPIQAKS